MPKELLELLNKINAKKQEVKNLVQQGKLDEAEAAKEKLVELQREFDIMKDLYDNERPAVNSLHAAQQPNAPPASATAQSPAGLIPAGEPADSTHEFAQAARQGFRTDLMSEGTNADGGYTVPEDIQTQIQHYKEANAQLRSLVSVENVRTNKGARTYQKKTQVTGFQKVLESGAVQEITGPKFERVTYEIEDYAGYMPVTNDLLADSDANITSEITAWIGRNAVQTDNNEVLAIIQGKAETSLSDLKGIKKAINVTLGQAYRSAVRIVTNDDGLNYLDTLEDDNKRPLLNPNPTEPNAVQLRVGATVVPITVLPNQNMASKPVYTLTSDQTLKTKTYYTRSGAGTSASPYVYTAVTTPDVSDIATYYELTAYKVPFEIGDFKEGIKIFDRQKTNILASNVASVTGYNAFEQRGTLFRADCRMDYKQIDGDAWVNGYIQIDA